MQVHRLRESWEDLKELENRLKTEKSILIKKNDKYSYYSLSRHQQSSNLVIETDFTLCNSLVKEGVIRYYQDNYDPNRTVKYLDPVYVDYEINFYNVSMKYIPFMNPTIIYKKGHIDAIPVFSKNFRTIPRGDFKFFESEVYTIINDNQIQMNKSMYITFDLQFLQTVDLEGSGPILDFSSKLVMNLSNIGLFT